MSNWIKLSDKQPPMDRSVLGKWSNGHIEDVEFSNDGEDYVYHYLFDGESLDSEPEYWMEIPQ